MTRDYKARTNPRVRRGNRSAGFFWFVTGTVVGAFGVGLVWTLQAAKHTVPPPSPMAATEPGPAPTKPRFDFYNILPEMEVVVPDEELAAKAPPPRPKTPPPSKAEPPREPDDAEQKTAAKEPPAVKEKPRSDGASYLLQVASYRTVADAERLKAQLALLGMQAQIQKVTINGKDTYHRVRAGPYKGKDATNQARALLSGKGLESIAIKLK